PWIASARNPAHPKNNCRFARAFAASNSGCQQLADGCKAEFNSKSVCYQPRDDVPCPQKKVEAMLARIFATDPTEHLPLLSLRQLGRPPSPLACPQRIAPPASINTFAATYKSSYGGSRRRRSLHSVAHLLALAQPPSAGSRSASCDPMFCR